MTGRRLRPRKEQMGGVHIVRAGDRDPMSEAARLSGITLCGKVYADRWYKPGNEPVCTRAVGHDEAATSNNHPPSTLHVAADQRHVARKVWS